MRFFKKIPDIGRLLLIATIVAFSILTAGVLFMHSSVKNTPVKTSQSTTSPVRGNLPVLPITSIPLNSTPLEVANLNSQQQAISTQPLYGHFPYKQANSNQMMIIGSYATGSQQRFESLNHQAGLALMTMIYTAREKGIWIIPVSGFRTIDQQKKLFEDQIKRRGSAKEAAKISAPAGYSEHHTGFAVDLTDGKFPKQDITFEFEKTDAYLWLTDHAKEFGYELSFPRNNSQEVSFEPWHWRYVSSPEAAATFANFRNR